MTQSGRLCVLAAAGMSLLILALWRDGILHMVSVWKVSPAFTHGFFVPLVSAGLIWDGWRKEECFTTWPLALVGVALAGTLYAGAGKADLQFGQHVAVMLGLISVIALVMGRSFAIRHRFALLFLFTAVPFGEEFVPFLQEIVAAGIISTLNFLDITAVRVGLLIRTEPGDFVVAEACAGLRFMVAMVVSGILFSHLLLRTRWKQIALILACLIVPVLANLLRAVMVVLIGVYSDMELATGFDHFVYGWGLFAVIFGLMFLIAMWASEPGAPQRPRPVPADVHTAKLAWWGIACTLIIGGGVV